MKQVTIKYQPFPLLKFSRTIKGNFPQKVEELSPGQLIAVAGLVKGTILEISFLAAITGISKRIIKKLDDYQQFNLMELFTIFNTTEPFHDFIIKEIITSSHFSLFSSKSPFGGRAKRRGLLSLLSPFGGNAAGKGGFFSPKPKLKGFTFGQFIFADTHFGNYMEAKKPEELHRFVASLYLPAGKKFDENIIEETYTQIAKTDTETLEAIVINYTLLREWLAQVYPMIFVKDSFDSAQDDKKPASGNEKPASSNNGWIKIFENLVGDDLVNHDKYANLPIHNVLRFLTKRIKENIKKK